MLPRLVALLLLALPACGGWGEAATVTIEARAMSAVEARGESVAAIESGHHVIRVRRMIRVPDACRELAGDLAAAGSELTLRVTSHPTGERCPPGEAYLAYTATIEGLRPGRYELRVIHGYTSERRPAELVLEHPVVVLEQPVEVR